MPRRPLGLRPVRRPNSGTLSADELARRAKWGGIMPDVPELTPEQRTAWQALQEAGDAWVPQRALAYFWGAADPIHGDGPWSDAAFQEALKADGREINRVVRAHPGQRERLHPWLASVEALGIQRGRDPDPLPGIYYHQLGQLGYDAGLADSDNE